MFEGRDVAFGQIGYSLCVLQPGQPSGMYHSETEQEDFLVLAGECLLLVEEQERRFAPWDFVHCPPGTAHIFVGAGDGPCAIFMAGARREGAGILYPRSELALTHRAGVEARPPRRRRPTRRSRSWRPWQPRSGRAAADPLGLFGGERGAAGAPAARALSARRRRPPRAGPRCRRAA